MKWAVFVLALLPTQQAVSLDARDARGLAVRIDTLPASQRIDGLGIGIVRAEGRDVNELAKRMILRWKQEGDAVRVLHQRGWNLRARWRAGYSELIQWRFSEGNGELLHSTLDVRQRPAAVNSLPFALPSGCGWGRSVQAGAAGRSALQRTGFCAGEPRFVLQRLRASLLSRGWRVMRESALSLDLHHATQRGLIVLSGASQGTGTALVWLGESGHTGVAK